MDPQSQEYAKSGTDNAAASQEDAAFNPDITDPQAAKHKAGEGTEVWQSAQHMSFRHKFRY